MSDNGSAAFGRLCVETAVETKTGLVLRPAAFGRLCVETQPHVIAHNFIGQPPSGGCVLKQLSPSPCDKKTKPAAFGRLCVETVKKEQSSLTVL